MSNFKEMMRRARADAEAGEWTPKPGTHEADVVDGDAFESRGGDPYAKTRLRLVAPGDPDDGREWDHLMGFKSPQQQAISAGQLSLYGVPAEVLDNLEDVAELAAAMAELAGIRVTVSCRSRDGGGVWTNVTGSRTGKSDVPVDQLELGAPARNGADVDDDDVPF